MQQFALKNLFYSNSLISSQELKIESENNLTISTRSLNKNNSRTIPLDLIETEAQISKKPDTQLILFSMVNFVASIVFYFSSPIINSIIGQIITSVFLVISLLSLAASYKRPTTTYTFFSADSNAHLFSIHEPKSKNKLLATFITHLKQRIIDAKEIKKEKTVFDFEENNFSEFTEHLDFLYNYGVVNDATYEILANRIDEKVYGTRPETHLADVILLPVRSM